MPASRSPRLMMSSTPCNSRAICWAELFSRDGAPAPCRPRALVNQSRYLEEQLRELQSSLAKLQMQQERLNGQLDGMLNRIERLEFGQQNLAAQFQVVQSTQDQLHLVRDQVGTFLEKQNVL